jgi:hypothetical protein
MQGGCTAVYGYGVPCPACIGNALLEPFYLGPLRQSVGSQDVDNRLNIFFRNRLTAVWNGFPRQADPPYINREMTLLRFSLRRFFPLWIYERKRTVLKTSILQVWTWPRLWPFSVSPSSPVAPLYR